MATRITDSNTINALSGSPEKRLDIDPNGVLWAAICQNPGLVKFFYSANGGTTWTYAASSDISHGQSTATPSFFIDKEGFAHACWIVWENDPQVIRYARGVPTGTGTSKPGWKWTYLTISPANARLGTDADLIVHRSGAGWTAWVAYTQNSDAGMKVAQIGITSAGLLQLKNAQHGPNSGGYTYQRGSLEFAHTGDGRSASESPHLFLTTIVGGGNTNATRLNKATFSGGTWTWQVPVTLPAAYSYNSLMTSVFDGTRLYVAYVNQSGALVMYEWSGSGAATARNPPAYPAAHQSSSEMASLALSHDPVTDDIFLAWQDRVDADIYYARYVRNTLSWTDWTKAASVSAVSGDGKIALVKHPTRDGIDMIYGEVESSDPVVWRIFSQQLVALQRTPGPPTLTALAAGVKQDLSIGATFTWTYNKVSPGDSQIGWVFRRTSGSTTEYWNVQSRLWGTTLVVNNDGAQSVSFPPGAWETGKTYSWSVRVTSSTGLPSTFATDRVVISTSAPVVTVTDPYGIVYADSTPLVQWTYASSDPQRSYEIRVLAEADGINDSNPGPALWSSGVVNSASARSARVTSPLANGGAYRAYVRVTNVNGIVSTWDYSQFGIQTTPPDGPVVELLDETSYTTGVPSVRLDIQAQTSYLTREQDGGTGGWSPDTNVTVASVPANNTAQVFQGFSMTTISDGLMGVVTAVGSPPLAPFGQPQPLGPLSFPVVQGQTYTALASLRAMSTPRPVRTRIRWYDADDGTGNLIGEAIGEQFMTNTNVYTQALLSALAPVGAVLARMVIEVLGATAGGEGFWVAFPSFHPGVGADYQPGGLSTTQAVRVDRSDDGGQNWTVVVERVKTNLAQQATAYDRTMPLGVDTSYRAFTLSDFGDGSLLASEASPVATIALQSPAWTIRDPADPEGEMLAYVVGHDRSDDESSSVHWPAGRVYPIVDTEGPQSATGTLNIFVKQDDLADAIAVLRRTVPMIVQSPSGEVFLARLIRRKYSVESLRHKVIEVGYIEVSPDSVDGGEG